MDLDDLNDTEVFYLIKNEKKKILEFKNVYNELVNTFINQSQKYHTVIIDAKEDVEYIINILETPIQTTFTITLRFKDDPHHLLRFDFGNELRHKNDYGKPTQYSVIGSHLHIYALPDKKSIKNVVPISNIKEFKNISIIADAYAEFVRYTNINY